MTDTTARPTLLAVIENPKVRLEIDFGPRLCLLCDALAAVTWCISIESGDVQLPILRVSRKLFTCRSALRECLHGWCRPWSSKPVGGVNNAPSRFDSDTLPLALSPCFRAVFDLPLSLSLVLCRSRCQLRMTRKTAPDGHESGNESGNVCPSSAGCW